MDTVLPIAVDLYQAGRFRDCASACQQALLRDPSSEAALALLGTSHWAEGNLPAAFDAFRRLSALRPDVPEYRSNLATLLREQGRLQEAHDEFVRALALAPGHFDVLMNYGLVLLDLGRLAEARHAFLDAYEADPSSLEARILAAASCFECGDVHRAEKLAPTTGDWGNLDREMRNRLVLVLIQIGRLDAAEALLKEYGDRNDPSTIARLAMLYERTNRITDAQALLDMLAPHLPTADHELRVDILTLETALASRAKNYSYANQRVSELLELELPPQIEANACFTAAGIADKLGDVDSAMTRAARAHAIYFRIAGDIVPEIAASRDKPLSLASAWLESDAMPFPSERGAPAPDHSPVFIVGFPRSGTTMLEQMLDAHPRFVSMDERTIIQKCVERMQVSGRSYPDALSKLSGSELDDLRAHYWREASVFTDFSNGRQLVDKNPLNMLRLPMIRRLFPEARIIFALRHPCDVLLSCYLQNFRSPAFMVLCSELPRLSRAYANAMEFWIHHAARLAPDALVLRYEDTVTNFPAQAERIGAFLGVDDASHFAGFADHAARKAYISTPSYSQVVEPVNTKAMGRWTAYRRYFEPVLPILEPIARHWGYDFGTP